MNGKTLWTFLGTFEFRGGYKDGEAANIIVSGCSKRAAELAGRPEGKLNANFINDGEIQRTVIEYKRKFLLLLEWDATRHDRHPLLKCEWTLLGKTTQAEAEELLAIAILTRSQWHDK